MRNKYIFRAFLSTPAVFNLLFACVANAATEERRSTLADQTGVAVTIYNDDLALVKEARKVTLDAGVNKLAIRDVSARMRPETAQLRSASSPGSLKLLEQNFDFDILTPAKMLEKYVGRTVRIIKTHPTTGAETIESAQVLAASSGIVLQIGDRIETGLPGRIVYESVPPNLRDRPTLVTELTNSRPGEHNLELSYLTGGISWKADYVAELNSNDSSIDLNGWVTLTNKSGTTYSNARLQLVAGDVNRVRDELQFAAKRSVMAMEAAAPADAMKQEALLEYYLYGLGRTTTIADNQTKQVALLNASSVPVKKEMIFQGDDYYYQSSVGNIGQKLKAAVFAEFENRENANLGIPIPKGIVRVYKKDGSGNAQFVGEDRIDHVPKNEKVRLRLGNAFDVTADKKQTDYQRRETTNRASHVSQSAYEIVIKNAKAEAVTVIVREPVPGQWKMLEESMPHSKIAAGTAEWRVTVPASGSSILRYRVETRF